MITLITTILTIISIPFIWKILAKFSKENLGIKFIKDKPLRDYVLNANTELRKNNYKDSATYMAFAFNLFINRFKSRYVAVTGEWFPNKLTVENLIEKKIIEIDFLEYKKFRQWMPNIITFENGSTQTVLLRSYTTEDTESGLRFCLKFLTKGILDNQSRNV